MFYIGNARTVFQEMVLDGSYNRHVLITGVLISGIHCITVVTQELLCVDELENLNELVELKKVELAEKKGILQELCDGRTH